MNRRLYHIVAINERTGKKVYMTGYPMPHHQAVTNLRKISHHRGRRVQLEEVVDRSSRSVSRRDPTDDAYAQLSMRGRNYLNEAFDPYTPISELARLYGALKPKDRNLINRILRDNPPPHRADREDWG